MSGTYERIWLQCPNTDPENEWCGEITWCQDKINDDDVEYVRGDIVESLRQWKREAIEVLDEWDETWIAADKPGSLGKSKAQGVKELVESLRQRVSDVVERQCDLCSAPPEFAFGDGTQICRKCVQESANHRGLLHTIKSLRQRVTKLAAKSSNDNYKIARLEAELAALKAGQGRPNLPLGEPVAYGLVMPSGQIDFELIGTLEDCKFWSRAESERQSGWKIAALYTAPTIPEGWIQITERMPDEYDTVLIGRIDVPWAITGFWTGDKWVNRDVREEPLEPTHWMPLPAAPKPEEGTT